MNDPHAVSKDEMMAKLASGELALKDTTSKREADSIRVIDLLPIRVQTLQFLNGDYCVAKFYGLHRAIFAALFLELLNERSKREVPK